MKKSTNIVFWILYMILVILNIIAVYAGVVDNVPPYQTILQTIAACLWAKSAGMQLALIILNKKADD